MISNVCPIVIRVRNKMVVGVVILDFEVSVRGVSVLEDELLSFGTSVDVLQLRKCIFPRVVRNSQGHGAAIQSDVNSLRITFTVFFVP